MILLKNPVRHPYNDYMNVTITIPIKLASDRQSLDFYRPISVAAIRTQVLVFSTSVPRNMQLEFSDNS
jgi:hypothetical protein